MRILDGTVVGTLMGRPNRWTVMARVGGRREYCFCCNPGRLQELFVPGCKLHLRPQRDRGGPTTHDLVAVECEGLVVPVDTRVPNRLVLQALLRRSLVEFRGHTRVVPEFHYGHSRLDFYLDGRRPCLLEVKSCTLVRDGVALFPDAPTSRGTRHLRDLVQARAEGYRAAVMFVVQRPDARVFRPLDANDPAFGATLRVARRAGVEILAYGCRLRHGDFDLHHRLAVDLRAALPSG